MDDKIKNAFQNWEDNPSRLLYNKEKIWVNIASKKKKRFVLYYPAVAAVALLCLLGSWGYFFYSNQQLEREYQAKLLEITQQKKEDVKLVLKKETENKNEIKTEIKEVVKETPILKAKVKLLEKKLAKVEQDKEFVNSKLNIAVSQVGYLKDSISLLNTNEVKPLLAENKFEKKKKGKEIRININKEALAELPVNIIKEKDNNKLRIMIKEEQRISSETSAPLFASIQLK